MEYFVKPKISKELIPVEFPPEGPCEDVSHEAPSAAEEDWSSRSDMDELFSQPSFLFRGVMFVNILRGMKIVIQSDFIAVAGCRRTKTENWLRWLRYNK